MRSAVLLILSLFVLVASPAADRQVVFRSAARRVVLDVVVVDSHGRPVEDLHAGDFEVRQAGKLQVLGECEFVKVPLGNRKVSSGALVLPDLAPSTNATPKADTRAFAILIDDATLVAPDILPAKLLIQQLVRRTTPDDIISITYVSRSDLGVDFTHDGARVLRGAEGMTAAFGSGSVVDPFSSVHESDDLTTIAALSNVVNALASAREPRRTILLVGRGTYAKRYDHLSEWARLYESARQAGTPIHTIDPSGLLAAELGFELPLEKQTPGDVGALTAKRRLGQSYMREVAENTGGEAFVNRADISKSVDLMVSENGSYYTLVFEPDPYKGDGRFQSVNVRVRRPGLTVRARKGYVSARLATQTDSAAGLSKHLGEGTPGGDLPLAGLAFRLTPEDKQVIAVVDIGQNDANLSGEQLDIAWLALDADAHPTGRGAAALKAAPRPSAARGVRVLAVLDVRPNTLVIRIGVSSRARRASGWIHVPLEPLRHRNESVAATPILLSGHDSEIPALAVLGNVEAMLPFSPSTRRTFSSAETLEIFCRFGPLPGEATAALRVVRLSDSREVYSSRPTIVHLAKAADVTAEVPLAGLGSGEYPVDLVASADRKDTYRATIIAVR